MTAHTRPKTLRSAGLRCTRQREQVWELLCASPAGLTIPQAAAFLAGQGVGQATVYRTFRTLVAAGLARPVHRADGESRYVASTPGHSHMVVCRGCARAVEFEECGVDTLERLVALTTGFRVEGHHLELYGLCPSCQGR